MANSSRGAPANKWLSTTRWATRTSARCGFPQAEMGAVEASSGEEVPLVSEEPEVPAQVGPRDKGGHQGGAMSQANPAWQAGRGRCNINLGQTRRRRHRPRSPDGTCHGR